MKYLAILFTILVSASFTAVSAVQTSQTPAPIDVGKPSTVSDAYRTADYEISKKKTVPTEETLRQARENKLYITKYVDPIYRDPTEAELRSVAVDPAVKSLFAGLLSQPHSGIFKITPDLGCVTIRWRLPRHRLNAVNFRCPVREILSRSGSQTIV